MSNIDNYLDQVYFTDEFKKDKDKVHFYFTSITSALLKIEEEYNKEYFNKGKDLENLFNSRLFPDEKLRIDKDNGKIKFIVIEDPLTYLDTPLRKDEDEVTRLRHLMALSHKIDLASTTFSLGTESTPF